jgi:hypothetical protein
MGSIISVTLRARRDFALYLVRAAGWPADEARRRIERELDLEEASLAVKRKGEPDPPL